LPALPANPPYPGGGGGGAPPSGATIRPLWLLPQLAAQPRLARAVAQTQERNRVI
jgi:hypothetical protein